MKRVQHIAIALALAVCLGAVAAEGGSGGAGGGGGSGGAGGAGGGAGGSGGNGSVLEAETPKVTDEQIAAFEKSLTGEQREFLETWSGLMYSAKERELKELEAVGPSDQSKALRAALADRAAFKREAMSWLVTMKPEDVKKSLDEEMPRQLQWLRQEADPWYTTPQESKAAEKLGAEAQKAVDALLSDDIDAFILARRKVLSYGPDIRALVAAAGRKAAGNQLRAERIRTIFPELIEMEQHEKAIRVAAVAKQSLADLEAARPKEATGKLAVMMSRSFAFNSSDTYGDLVYFSLPKGVNGYKGAVSLQFDNGDGSFNTRMYGGQENSIKDLGEVDYAGVKSAPNADDTEQWGENAAPVVGHVYIEHCFEPRDKIDATFKFRVLALKPREWVVIEYEKIPQKQ